MKRFAADRLKDLADSFQTRGWRVWAPVLQDGVVRLAQSATGSSMELGSPPVNSLKDILFPPAEVLCRFSWDGDSFSTLSVESPIPKTVAFARPCDAAALAVLDAVFHWDSRDAFYDARRAALTVLSMACPAADAQCFCTSVGGGPDKTDGADAIIRPAEKGTAFVFEALTEKGLALEQAALDVLEEGSSAPDAAPSIAPRFRRDTVTNWLGGNFASALWQDWSLACLGCGACAYACPACHCFDIQDESTRTQSVRRRCWDSCGFGLFTLHAGGHNPRPDQASRFRQRIMHKFSYFPQRFGRLACTGCGRCTRVCQARVGVLDACQAIDSMAEASP